MSRFNWAPTAYKLLNGVLCVYKPDGLSSRFVVNAIKTNLTKDLNKLPCYQHEIPLGQRKIRATSNVSALSLNTEPSGIQDWSEHRLVLGDRYEESDLFVNYVDRLALHSSGVLVLGVGKFGQDSLSIISMAKYLRVYHVKGRFGWATHNFSARGRILERSSYKHVNKSKIERVCAAAQGAHTRQMYNLHGVNPDSQEAYEMAATGIIRPATRDTHPILYSIKCIDFQPPDFTLEIHSINESCEFLTQFIHDLAIKLKTSAVCTGIRRLRYGTFDLQRALLRQQWHLDPIIDNIESNLDLLTPELLFVGTQAEPVKLPPVQKHKGHLPGGHKLAGHLTDGHLKDGHLKDGHLTDGHLTNGHLTNGHLKDGHLTDGHLKDGHLKDGHLKDGHLKDGHLKDGYLSSTVPDSHAPDGRVPDSQYLADPHHHQSSNVTASQNNAEPQSPTSDKDAHCDTEMTDGASSNTCDNNSQKISNHLKE
ncbi:pseudouridylate synthase TRUB2, mitochondrial-like [Physella acuta]|uniref:pseudouridylate synthase TRUB2, mitochondrial-like n=1 Tax=Physella acuta TaxID=109671 RepID=UPI0027DC63FD|nr:pseudouridylate synthase TRUB2, mitochondrial-like [Physella acuta]